ncbi:MAG: hypothetical protein L0K70_06845 [Bifidobacterium crudilactis]|nr:hypothetical protein [Bifidobacterium crudilactis]
MGWIEHPALLKLDVVVEADSCSPGDFLAAHPCDSAVPDGVESRGASIRIDAGAPRSKKPCHGIFAVIRQVRD